MSESSLSIYMLAVCVVMRQIQKDLAVAATVPVRLKCNVTLVVESLNALCEGGKELVLLRAVVGVAGCGPACGFPHLLPSRVPKSALNSTAAGQNRGHCFKDENEIL